MKSVGIGQIVVADGPDDVVGMIGLGSCVGIFCAVPGRLVTAAHVLLPDSGGKDVPSPGKYGDTAVTALSAILRERGVPMSKVQVSLAGGGQVLSFSDNRPELEIGRRNIEAVTALLSVNRLTIVEDITGGTSAASVKLRVATGRFEAKRTAAA